MGNSCAVHCVFSNTGITLVHHSVLLHSPPPALPPLPASLLVAICCRDNHRRRSWPYDELTLALTGEAFLLIHTDMLTYRSTLFDRDAQIQTRSDMYTRTHDIRPLCPAMSQHSPGGHLSVVPCLQAIMLHDWLISSRALWSLVLGCCSLSLWKCCALKFHFVPCTLFLLEMCSHFT